MARINEWMTSKEAATLLGINDRYVRFLGSTGRFATIQLNPKMRLYRRRDVESYKPAKRGPKPKKKEAVTAGTTPGM